MMTISLYDPTKVSLDDIKANNYFADFVVENGTVQILCIDGESDVSFEDYLNAFIGFRESITRKPLTLKRNETLDKVTNQEIALSFIDEDNDYSNTTFVNVDSGPEGIDMENLVSSPCIKSFFKDFIVIDLDGENSSIVSPFSMIRSDSMNQIVFDIFVYCRSVRVPGFGVINEDKFVLDGQELDATGLMNHPLFNSMVIKLYIQSFSDEPLIFFCRNSEDDIKSIIKEIPSERISKHPPILFVVKEN